MTGVEFLVIESWDPAPRRPLVLKRGDRVAVGNRDTEWTSYLWCAGPDGTGGWVPQEYLAMDDDATATVTVDYSTVELAVAPGDVVSGYQTTGNWTWCVAGDGGSGWVPNKALSRPVL